MARRGEIPSKPPMEEAIAAAEATLEALVKAAEDFAVPLIAEQRAVLAAADAKAADAASPARDAFETVRAEFEKKIDELDGALTSAVEKERAEIAVVARAAREDPFAEDEDADVATIVASVFDPAREHLGERLRNSRSAAEKMLQWLERRAADLDRAATDAASKAADAGDGIDDDSGKHEDWAADEESDLEDLPPLGGDWAEDDEDDLPPLEGEWQKDAEAGPSPTPPSPKKKPAAFKPRDASPPRGNAWGHAPPAHGRDRSDAGHRMGSAAGRDVDLRDRLGGGGSRDYGGDRRSSFDRGGDYGRDRGGGGFRDSWGAPGGGYRDDRRGGGGGGGHRSEYIERMERKYGRVDDGPPPRSTMRDRSPPKPPPEVHYPTRDEQRAEAKAREERAAWRLATRPLKEFFANAKKGEGISPSTIRELLNELSEPPFAEGRLAPNARKAFELVAASAKETGSKRTFEEVEELVRGVVNPLYHLLTYGVKAPGAEGGGPPSSVAETIAEQMHTAAVKLLAASLDILSKGDATKKAVESAKGIVIVREQVAAKLAGRAPGGGRGDKETTVTRRDSVDGRGHGKGSAANKPAQASGTDADRWDRKKDARPTPSPEVYRAPRGGEKSVGVMARLGDKNDSSSPANGVKPRAVPKVVIHRPFSEGKQRELTPSPAQQGQGERGGKPKPSPTPPQQGQKLSPFERGPASAASQALGKSPPSARGGVFARLEGKPKLQGLGKSDLPAPKPDAAKELPHPKSTEKELPHPKRVVVVHKPNEPNDHKELPHPKPAPKPRDPPAPPAKGARGDKEKPAKQRDALDDALDEELAKATKGKKGGRTKGGSDRQGAPSEPHKELPHPKPAAPAPGSEKPHPVPAPRPVSAPDSESAKQLPHPNKPPVPKGNNGRSPIPAPKPATNTNTGGSSVGGRPGSGKARNESASPPPPKERDELDDVLDAELEKAMGGGGGGKRRPRGGRGSRGGGK